MKRSTVALGLGAALGCFIAGLAAGQRFLGAPEPTPPVSSSQPRLELEQDAARKAPKIVFDEASLTLLPDASLRLDLPPGFDAGTP